MTQYREILRLTAQGYSRRNVAFSVGCSPGTVQSVVRRAGAAGLEWPLPEEMGDAAIRERLFPRAPREEAGRAPIDHARVAAEMSRKGVTMTLLWNEYVEGALAQGLRPYLYSAFCGRQREWARAVGSTMHVEWRPGEVMQVDWAGDPMRHRDPDTGELVRAWVFVGTPPFSARIYARAFHRMDERAWVEAHVGMFAFFGGVPELVLLDNLKAGVTKNTADELVLNEQYRRMLEHYGVAAMPGRVRRPRDKGSVEGAVGIVERQAIAALRDREFLSLDELNAALAARVDEINARPFQRREGSRDSVFASAEAPCLRPLPPAPYEMVERRRATVAYNYHISFDGRYYSVPHTLVRREVEVAATAWRVTVSAGGERVASHDRCYGPRGTYVTDPAHMPRPHRDWAEWTGDRFRAWAAEYGPSTAAVVDAILRSRQVEQHAYRPCRALISIGERHGAALLEEACSRALAATGRPSYKTVKTIAARLASEAAADPGAHAYVRGASAYGEE